MTDQQNWFIDFYGNRFPMDWAGEEVLKLRRILGNYASKQVLANGWYIDSKNAKLKKYLETIFSERNKFDSLLFDMEFALSYYGKYILTIDNTPNGIRLSPVEPFSMVGEVYVTENIAVVFKRIVWDQKKMLVREEWDKKEVKRFFYDGSNTSIVLSKMAKIDKKELPKAVERHNSKFLPVHQFNNLHSYRGGDKPDWYNCKHIEKLIYELIVNLSKELKYNRTRVFGNFTDDLANDENVQKVIQRINQDFIINTHSNADNPDSITVLQGNPKIKEYAEGMDKLIDIYWKMSGWARQSDSQIKQSATKDIFMRTDDIKTARQKRRNRQLELKRMLWKVIQLAKTNPTDSKYVGLGVEYDDFSVVIREGQEARPFEYVNDLKMKLDMNMTSLSEAIANDQQITKEEAKIKMQEIMQERKEFKELYELLDENREQQGFNNNQEKPKDSNKKNNEQKSRSNTN